MGALTRVRGAAKAVLAALAFIASIISFSAQGQVRDVRGTAPWRELADEAAERFGLPVEWVLRVIEAESGGRTMLGGRPITSRAGAMGLMQIMPATWASLRSQYALGSDPHDPRDNIIAGTAYLRAMYDHFGYPGLFAAYNAGPGRYGEYLSRGRPLPRETRDYVAKIAGGHSVAAPSARVEQIAADGPASPDALFLLLRNSAVQKEVAREALFGDRAGADPSASKRDKSRDPTAGGIFVLLGSGDDARE